MRSASSHVANPDSRESAHSAERAPIIQSISPRDTDVAPPPPSDPRRRARAKRIVRTEYLESASLEPAQRCALIDQLYPIYCETLHGYTRDEFETLLVFSADDGRLALFYDARGDLAGFSYASFERIEHAGRAYAVLCAGMFFRPGYHGGVSGSLFLLREGLLAKLRDPRTPLAYMTRCTTPAVYRRLARTMPRIYPSRKHQTPADVEALVGALGIRRHYVPVSQSPWVVKALGVPNDSSRLRRIEDDPDVRFYADLNPRFAEGESLVVWAQAHVSDIASGFVRLLHPRLTR